MRDLPLKVFAAFCLILPSLHAQIELPNIGRTNAPPPPPKEAPAKNQLSLTEMNTLDVKFVKDLETAQDFVTRETFANATQSYSQMIQELEALIKRIAVSTLPKNSFIEVDGVKTPATIQAETDIFTRILDKAKHGRDLSEILAKVVQAQDQASNLLIAGKYPDDLNAYQKSLQFLNDNRQQLGDAKYQFYSARSLTGIQESHSDNWHAIDRALRKKFNRTTEEPKMTPEEIRGVIKSVADEISGQGYTDQAKHPEMPDDTRASFASLLTAANQYLAAQ